MKKTILICLLCYSAHAFSQGADTAVRQSGFKWYRERYISVLTGYNLGKYQFAELGIARNSYGVNGHHPFASSYFASCEAKLNPNQQTIIAPKLGGWVGGGFAMGVNLLYYNNLKTSEGSLRFRPEFGICLDYFKVVYGYNMALSNKDFTGISSHNLNFTILIGVKKLKDK